MDHRNLSLAVVGTPSVTQAPPVEDAGTAHAQYVAALDNKGTLGQNDTQLLGHVSNVGSYWAAQSNGAMTVSVPSAVAHYDTAVTPTACGLGSGQTDFFNLVQEAMGEFPGHRPVRQQRPARPLRPTVVLQRRTVGGGRSARASPAAAP